VSVDQSWWSRFGKTRHDKADEGRNDLSPGPEDPQAPIPTSTVRARPVGDCDGAMVARSQIVVSGSTATLLGTMTNETGCDVHFSGTPPYALTFDSDGSRPILLGDFNSPPRERPSSADWVIHPGASVPYRSLPVTLQTPDPRWDGTHWCESSQSTTLDVLMQRSPGELATIQIFS
jgi:hypothetical protein